MDCFTWLGTACSIISAIIALYQAYKVRQYRMDIYRRAKVIYFNMALEHLRNIQKTIRDIEDAQFDEASLRGKDSIGAINRYFDELFGKIFTESGDSEIVKKLEWAQDSFQKFASKKDKNALRECSRLLRTINIDINNYVFKGEEQ